MPSSQLRLTDTPSSPSSAERGREARTGFLRDLAIRRTKPGRMTMAVITPSFGPDFELCADLHRSMIDLSPESVHHHIIVPHADVRMFGRLAGPRTHIHCESDFLPPAFRRLPLTKYTFNLRRPFPPIRGWILQQIVKLAAAAASAEDVVLLVDSDIAFVRPFNAETFVRNGVVRFYTGPVRFDATQPQHARHIVWHDVARALLGLPAGTPPYADFISSLMAWDPAIVRRMLDCVAARTGLPWTTAVARQLHFSEWTLYGVFVDEVIGGPANSFRSDDSLCRSYWDPTPLDQDAAADFFRGLRPTDVAAMISAKSRTPLAIRRAAFAGQRTLLAGHADAGSPTRVREA